MSAEDNLNSSVQSSMSLMIATIGEKASLPDLVLRDSKDFVAVGFFDRGAFYSRGTFGWLWSATRAAMRDDPRSPQAICAFALVGDQVIKHCASFLGDAKLCEALRSDCLKMVQSGVERSIDVRLVALDSQRLWMAYEEPAKDFGVFFVTTAFIEANGISWLGGSEGVFASFRDLETWLSHSQLSGVGYAKDFLQSIRKNYISFGIN